MKREWQPGDVATGTAASAAGKDDQWRVFFYRDHDDNVVKYMYDDGSGDEATHAPRLLRPLAVVDPEAAIPDEWVRVFDTACTATDRDVIRSGLAALFAHIAAPPEPKPEEPRQHMAVVRDEDGVEWCRIQIGPTPWRSGAGEYRDWADLDVPADGVLWGGVE